MDSATDIIFLHECRPLSARITVRQCLINRKRGLYSCADCFGLGDDIVEAIPVKEEEIMAKQKHPKCLVPGCTKIRVAKCDGMCRGHFVQYGSRAAMEAALQELKVNTTEQNTATRGVGVITEALETVQRLEHEADDYASTLNRLEKIVSEVESSPDRKTITPISFLSRIKSLPMAIPPMSILVDFTGHEELFADVKANSEDISAGIIELVQLYMDGKLRLAS